MIIKRGHNNLIDRMICFRDSFLLFLIKYTLFLKNVFIKASSAVLPLFNPYPSTYANLYVYKLHTYTAGLEKCREFFPFSDNRNVLPWKDSIKYTS